MISCLLYVGIPGFEPGTLPPLAQERGGMRYPDCDVIHRNILSLLFIFFNIISNWTASDRESKPWLNSNFHGPFPFVNLFRLVLCRANLSARS
jgi:hypothetical protein